MRHTPILHRPCLCDSILRLPLFTRRRLSFSSICRCMTRVNMLRPKRVSQVRHYQLWELRQVLWLVNNCCLSVFNTFDCHKRLDSCGRTTNNVMLRYRRSVLETVDTHWEMMCSRCAQIHISGWSDHAPDSPLEDIWQITWARSYQGFPRSFCVVPTYFQFLSKSIFAIVHISRSVTLDFRASYSMQSLFSLGYRSIVCNVSISLSWRIQNCFSLIRSSYHTRHNVFQEIFWPMSWDITTVFPIPSCM